MLRCRLVTESFNPEHAGLTPEPGQLSLGVVAMALLRGLDGGLKGQGSGQNGGGLAVTERVKRLDGTVAGEQGTGFFDETRGEHGHGAVVEAVGSTTDIAVDAHWRYNASDMIKVARELEPFRLMWLEDPVPPNQLTALKEVSSKTRVPIATCALSIKVS